LLGLLREPETVAASVLANLGLNPNGVRKVVLGILTHGPDWDEPVVVELVKHSAPDVDHLPSSARQVLAEFNCQIDTLTAEKEAAVGALEFEKAAERRDLEAKLKQLRDDFIRQWPTPEGKSDEHHE